VPIYPKGLYPEYDVWDAVLDDWWWLDRFNLPPREVDELPVDTYIRMQQIDTVAAQVRKAAHDKAAKG
jgi:hypothetical protein